MTLAAASTGQKSIQLQFSHPWVSYETTALNSLGGNHGLVHLALAQGAVFLLKLLADHLITNGKKWQLTHAYAVSTTHDTRAATRLHALQLASSMHAASDWWLCQWIH